MQFGIDNLRAYVQGHTEQLIVLADKHTLALCYPKLGKDLPHFTVPYGEGYKTLHSCEYIWKKLTDMGANRHTTLLCLGGGVLCDMGAFAGSVFQRGMKIVLCPTSLLAMVDASVGGKNGVNFMGYKNYIGNFREADEIFICHDFLESLPEEEWVNGHVEMLKHGLIASRSHYDKVKLLFMQDGQHVSEEMIRDSIEIKLQHVEEDFRDEGIRKRLNFGHTVGHAIESWSLSVSAENEELSHGVAVALGIIAESYLSFLTNGLKEDDLNEITTLVHPVMRGRDHPIPGYSEIAHYLYKDKKNRGREINFSLLTSIGNCVEDRTVGEEQIKAAMKYLKEAF